MSKPHKVAVAIRLSEAPTEADAKRLCKLSQAYRQILADYPSSGWERRYLQTTRDDKIGFWQVEFEVKKKIPSA